jgi:GntR family transcriptional repressor for pyruvate dehydrogenase complex
MAAANKNNRIFEQVLYEIRDHIQSCNLVAGDKLMTEREMASFLQVSRSSVREALRIMEMFDVIQSRPGEGTVLKTPYIPKVLTNMLPFFNIPTETSVELLESRKVLEGGIVKLAAKRRKDKDIQLMQNALDRMGNTNDLQAMIQADVDFHLHLAKAAYNNTLSDILIVVSDLVMPNLYATRLRTHAISGVSTVFVHHHTAILQAVIEKDGDRAYREMENHIDFSIETMKLLDEGAEI